MKAMALQVGAVVVAILTAGCGGPTGDSGTSKHHYWDVVAATGTFSLTGTNTGECTGTTSASSVTLSLPEPKTRQYYFYDGKSASVGGGVNLHAVYSAPAGTNSCSACPTDRNSTTVLFDLSLLEDLGENPSSNTTVTPIFGAMDNGEVPLPCNGVYTMDSNWLRAKPVTVGAFKGTGFSFENSGTIDVHEPGPTTFDGTLTYSFKIDLQPSKRD